MRIVPPKTRVTFDKRRNTFPKSKVFGVVLGGVESKAQSVDPTLRHLPICVTTGFAMGRPDQLLKYMLELEAPQATHNAVTFKLAPEIPTTEITPDGLLLTNTPERLADLPAPWCLLHHEAVVDGKMPGDHLDPLAVERCLWRRQARQVQRIDKEDADPAPADCAAWIVAPHRPEWLDDWQRSGWVQLQAVGAGCTLIQPSFHPFVWIAANELPLHDTLVPFLLARSGQKLKDFIRWVLHVRTPEWLASVVRTS